MKRVSLPRGFNAWVVTSVGFELGSGVLAFALTWVASGYGPNIAAGVLTLTVAPSVILGLLGGAVADRFGPRRVMIAGTLALMIVSAGLAFAALLWGPSPPFLLVVATLIGAISAFHRPAVGVFPRLFVDDHNLGAAMARAGIASQIARTIAPPLGGLLIGMITLSGVALVDVIGCAAMLVTLAVVHPPLEQSPVDNAVTLRGIFQGISRARKTSGIPTLLMCVAVVAGAVIPAVVLGIPLAARERGWTAGEAGLIEAGWIAGGILAGAWFAWRRDRSQSMAPHGHWTTRHNRRTWTTRNSVTLDRRCLEHNPDRRRRRHLHRTPVPDLRLVGSPHNDVEVPEPAHPRPTSTATHHQPTHRHRSDSLRRGTHDRNIRNPRPLRLPRNHPRQDATPLAGYHGWLNPASVHVHIHRCSRCPLEYALSSKNERMLPW